MHDNPHSAWPWPKQDEPKKETRGGKRLSAGRKPGKEFKLLKKHIAVLDKIMSREIQGFPIAQMKQSKAVNELLEADFIQEEEMVIGGRFPVRCEGYAFTTRGHILYCEWCAKNAPNEE